MAAALIWAPTASSAATWVGQMKENMICPGAGIQKGYDNFTLDMVQGSSVGLLTFAGAGTVDVVTDWTVDGRWGYFSASFIDPNGGPWVFYGSILGRRMKGWIIGHSYGDGCILWGKLRAYAQ
jgi:hypothetical protein